MRTRALHRQQIFNHMQRRLTEDRNQHYDDLTCPCWYDARVRAQFKEQPKSCSKSCCGNPRRFWGEPTRQELRADQPLI